MAPLDTFVLGAVPGATVFALHPVPNERRFLLPLASRPKFGSLLRGLETHSHELGVASLGISVAPLEEVFLCVGAESRVLRAVGREGDLPADDFYRSAGGEVSYAPSFAAQALGVFLRRLQVARNGLGVDVHALGKLIRQRQSFLKTLEQVLPLLPQNSFHFAQKK